MDTLIFETLSLDALASATSSTAVTSPSVSHLRTGGLTEQITQDRWAEIVAELTRRGFLLGGSAATLSLGVGACSRGGSGSGSPSGSPSQNDATGSIPTDPKRVIALTGRVALDFALTAEYPIVASVYDEKSPLRQFLPDGVKQLASDGIEYNWEEIYSLQPDLLVIEAGWAKPPDVKRMEQGGVPVLDVNRTVAGYDEWSIVQRYIVEELTAVGREKQAQAARQDYQAAVAAGKQRIGNRFDGKVLAIGGAGLGKWWLNRTDIPTGVATDLGVQLLRSDGPSDDSQAWFFSAETLDIFAKADLILMQGLDVKPDTFDVGTFQRLPAVKAGHLAPLPLWARNGGYKTATEVVDLIVNAIDLLD